MSKIDVYNQRIQLIHEMLTDGEEIRVAELKALVLLGTDEEVTDQEFQALADAQAKMRQEHGALVEALDKHKISREQYLDKFIETTKVYTKESLSILGEKRFLEVFGEAGKHPEGLIDRKTFLNQ